MSRFVGLKHLASRCGLAATMMALGLVLSGCPEEGVECGEGLTVCGSSCVDLAATAAHCGACGVACGDGQMCVEGSCKNCSSGVCTYDVVATCFNTGQVVGIQAGTDIKGPNIPLGDHPLTAARMQDVLVVVDATATRLREARLTDYATLSEAPATGDAPNQVLVDDPYVYVLNSASNTLLVLQRKAEPGPLTDGTRFPQGLRLEPVASVDFGANTNPFAMALLGTEMWVTLYGNLVGEVSAGGKVARVKLADPLQPELIRPYLELPSGAALQPFEGYSPVPTPSGIIARAGRLYVALNNLDPTTYSPGGPGLLARIDPRDESVRYLPLGEDCLNPGWLAPMGGKLLVSCAGEARYDSDFNLIGVNKTGVVLLDEQDTVVDAHAIACPEASGGSCALPSAGRFAVVGNRVYVGDNNAGRIFVSEVSGNQLIERRGLDPKTGAEAPILACPNDSGASLVGDVIAIQ